MAYVVASPYVNMAVPLSLPISGQQWGVTPAGILWFRTDGGYINFSWGHVEQGFAHVHAGTPITGFNLKIEPDGQQIVQMSGISLPFPFQGLYFENINFTLRVDFNELLLGNDQVSGTTGAERLYGYSGNDLLTGNGGNDTVQGGEGNDVIVGDRGGSNDAYRGGAGIDTVRYLGAEAGITVALYLGSARSTDGANAANIGIDRLTGIENVLGGVHGDYLIGDSASNRLDGSDGDDRLNGGNGSDFLFGGNGADLLAWGTGDRLRGGAGVDTLQLAGGSNLLDLRTLGDSAITNIERINLAGGGDDTVRLDSSDVLALSSTTDKLLIMGDAGDTLELDPGWTDEGPDGSFLVLTRGTARLLVDNDLTILFS